jgi:hypothetical protein
MLITTESTYLECSSSWFRTLDRKWKRVSVVIIIIIIIINSVSTF